MAIMRIDSAPPGSDAKQKRVNSKKAKGNFVVSKDNQIGYSRLA